MSCVHRTKDGVCRKCSAGKYVAYCPDGPCPEQVVTNGDRIRAMTDEELAEGLLKLYRETTDGDIARLWCDGKAGCVDEYGNIDCDEHKHKACVLRFLGQPVEDTP